eukprot:COSAG03_NODE_2070_length_3156_cov_7.928361_3_plen_144_part_00
MSGKGKRLDHLRAEVGEGLRFGVVVTSDPLCTLTYGEHVPSIYRRLAWLPAGALLARGRISVWGKTGKRERGGVQHTRPRAHARTHTHTHTHTHRDREEGDRAHARAASWPKVDTPRQIHRRKLCVSELPSCATRTDQMCMSK